MRSEKCCTSVILLHQKPNLPHLCLRPTFAFQKGATGMPFLHIYIWLKALNDHVMKNIVADLREILHFETMSGTLIKDVLTLQQTNRRILYVFYFSNNFKSTNKWTIRFSRLACNWLQMIAGLDMSWPSLRGPIIVYFVHMQPIIWNKGGLERTASLKQSHVLAFWKKRRQSSQSEGRAWSWSSKKEAFINVSWKLCSAELWTRYKIWNN